MNKTHHITPSPHPTAFFSPFSWLSTTVCSRRRPSLVATSYESPCLHWSSSRAKILLMFKAHTAVTVPKERWKKERECSGLHASPSWKTSSPEWPVLPCQKGPRLWFVQYVFCALLFLKEIFCLRLSSCVCFFFFFFFPFPFPFPLFFSFSLFSIHTYQFNRV